MPWKGNLCELDGGLVLWAISFMERLQRSSYWCSAQFLNPVRDCDSKLEVCNR